MKFSKNHYAYRFFYDDDVSVMFPREIYQDVANRTIKFLAESRNTDIKFFKVSKTLVQSFLPCVDSIHEAWLKNSINIKNRITYTILLPANRAFFIDIKPDGDYVTGKIIKFKKNKNYVDIDGFYEIKPPRNPIEAKDNYFLVGGWDVDKIKYYKKDPIKAEQYFNGGWVSAVSFVLFMQYADIETRRVAHNRKIKSKGDNLINKTKIPITFVDSTWLTNIVREKEFKVRGHFRFQPCGQGLKDRKLIWIDEFKKKGYNKAARRWKEMPSTESSTRPTQ